MNYEQFKDYAAKSIEAITGGKVEIYPVVKNNSLVLDGLSIREEGETQAVPTIYPEQYFRAYEQGTPAAVLVKEMLEFYERRKQKLGIRAEHICDFEQMKKRIMYKLVSRSLNEELLKRIPHRQFLDLEIVYYALFWGEELSDATMLIEDSHLKLWNVNEEELFCLASENTPEILKGSVRGMDEVMEEMLLGDIQEAIGRRTDEEGLMLQTDEIGRISGEMLESVKRRQETLPMFVLTNSRNLNGAACMLYDGMLEQCARAVGGSFYILPSSVHEVLLIPCRGMHTEEELSGMVREVNRTQVASEEVLSDHVYIYHSRLGKITMQAEHN